MKPRESDMYLPIKELLQSQGFIVRGEVRGCDIAAVSGETLWVVEMKLSANLTLIFQAMERMGAANAVFVAIPRPKRARDKNFLALQRLLKKLGLGLVTVALDSPARYAEIILFPEEKKKKANKKTESIKKEIFGRTSDTIGGVSGKKVNTAYRERCIFIACVLEKKGALSVKNLREMGCEGNISNIFSGNYFGWFEKKGAGTYDITEICRNYLAKNADTTLITYYRMKSAELY